MSIGKKIALGAAWMMLMKFSIRLIGLVSTLILVRLLDPADFGIAAMAMTVVTAVQLLTMFGFDVAIIQNQNADKDDYNTAWTLNVALGLGAGLLLIALAYPAAGFYGRPELVAVYMALSLATIFQGLENIGRVDFRKHLHFNREFQFRVAVKGAAFTRLSAFQTFHSGGRIWMSPAKTALIRSWSSAQNPCARSRSNIASMRPRSCAMASQSIRRLPAIT